MFENLFWFGGRIGRLAYFGWSLASVAIAVVVAFVLVLLVTPISGEPASLWATQGGKGFVAGLGTAAIFIWMSLALQAKRLRDMGRDPFVWIVGFWTVLLFDQFVLTSYVSARYSSHAYGVYTPLGGIASVVYWVMLQFMPSTDGASDYGSAPRGGASPVNRLKFN